MAYDSLRYKLLRHLWRAVLISKTPIGASKKVGRYSSQNCERKKNAKGFSRVIRYDHRHRLVAHDKETEIHR